MTRRDEWGTPRATPDDGSARRTVDDDCDRCAAECVCGTRLEGKTDEDVRQMWLDCERAVELFRAANRPIPAWLRVARNGGAA